MEKQKVNIIIQKLASAFPDAKPELEYSSAYELLVAVILSAQCTDKRVNQVTKELFKKYNTPDKMLELSQSELADIIRPCGLNESKAKHILCASEQIVRDYNGQVPSTLDKLRTLAGVGRKTANVVYAVAFNGNAIAVDTHVFRVTNRIGIANSNNVLGTEKQLMQAIDENLWSKAHHYFIFLGRRICKARNPLCNECPIKTLCKNREDVCR